MIEAPTPLELQAAAEAVACRTSKSWLFERHFALRNTRGQLQLMSPLRRAQRKIAAVMKWFRDQGKPARLMIGKSRKQGSSSYIEADMLDEVMSKGIEGLVIAHDKPSSEYIFGICRRYYENMDIARPGIPTLAKPPLKTEHPGRKEMRFAHHEGSIEIDTANNPTAGRGKTPQYLHLSEVAFWEKGGDAALSLFQSIADLENTTIVMESTFNGTDPLFLPYWKKAWDNSTLTLTELPDGDFAVDFKVTNVDEWNGYAALFLSVLDDATATTPFADDLERDRFHQTLDAYESMLVDTYGAPLEYLKWRRHTIKHKIPNADVSFYKQEYPATVTESVRASGRSRFSAEILDSMRIEKPRLGRLDVAETWNKSISFKLDAGERLRVYRDPVKGHRYTVGVDIAEGIEDDHTHSPDASVICVLDIDNGGEQVATYYGQVSEENLVEPLQLIGQWYNSAYLVIETNSTGKHVGIEIAKVYPPEKVYRRMDWEQGYERRSKTIGWRTHVGSRNVLIGKLADAINGRSIALHDERTVEECKQFVGKAGGGYAAAPGAHDDHVFALGLAVIGIDSYPANDTTNPSLGSLLVARRAEQMRRTANTYTGY